MEMFLKIEGTYILELSKGNVTLQLCGINKKNAKHI